MNNLSILKITLRIFGIAFILIIPMMKLDPLGGWAWSPGQWEYEMMIQGVYMTLGVMMLIAANDPLKNPLFVWFVVWSSFVHGGIMASWRYSSFIYSCNTCWLQFKKITN